MTRSSGRVASHWKLQPEAVFYLEDRVDFGIAFAEKQQSPQKLLLAIEEAENARQRFDDVVFALDPKFDRRPALDEFGAGSKALAALKFGFQSPHALERLDTVLNRLRTQDRAHQ